MTVQIYTCSNHALRTLIGCKGVVSMATFCCLLSSSVITDMALNIYYGIYFTVLWNLTNSWKIKWLLLPYRLHSTLFIIFM